MSAQLGLGLFVAVIALVVVGGIVRTVTLIREGRAQFGTDKAQGPRWPMVVLHLTPFALVAGYLWYADAVGRFDKAGPLMAMACAMVIIQGVVVGVFGLRAAVVGFWVTLSFVVVEVAMATAMLMITLTS